MHASSALDSCYLQPCWGRLPSAMHAGLPSVPVLRLSAAECLIVCARATGCKRSPWQRLPCLQLAGGRGRYAFVQGPRVATGVIGC